jgi:diadenosine tetraphosphatase ApaH/serine/threonine PP2A family protein phosphatase
MRIAFLTDIHGNLEALEAVLEAVARLAVDRLVILGDLVGYGPDPAAVVERVGKLVDQGAVCIKGNHDHAACTSVAGMTENARIAIEWTRGQLRGPHIDYLSALQMAVRDEDRLYVHASAFKPESWPYIRSIDTAGKSLDATDARLTFVGHTHVPAVFHALPGQAPARFVPQTGLAMPLSSLRRAVVVVGSVGQPRDGNPAASFGLFDTAERTQTMLRAPYDFTQTAEKIRRSGLPFWLADRLAIGK